MENFGGKSTAYSVAAQELERTGVITAHPPMDQSAAKLSFDAKDSNISTESVSVPDSTQDDVTVPDSTPDDVSVREVVSPNDASAQESSSSDDVSAPDSTPDDVSVREVVSSNDTSVTGDLVLSSVVSDNFHEKQDEVILPKEESADPEITDTYQKPKVLKMLSPTNTPLPTPEYFESNVVLANTSILNIRSEASTAGENTTVIGKMFKNSYAFLIEDMGEWLKVQTGTIGECYISSEFSIKGYEAAVIADRDKAAYCTVTADLLNVRSGPGTIFAKIMALKKGKTYPVTLTQSTQDWLCVTLENGNKGYISSEFASVGFNYTPGLTNKEVIAYNHENQVKEVLARAQIFDLPKTKREARTMTDDEIYTFATIIQTEAGNQSYEGKLAVANVILNRIDSGRWGSTLSEVLFAPGQFTGADKTLMEREQKVGITDDCFKAVKEALSGVNNIGDFLFFQTIGSANRNKNGCYDILSYNKCYRIGDHYFYWRTWN